jgi:Spy/CpxP family protein refolding chaperone
MRSWKMLASTLTVALGFVATAAAQPPRDPPPAPPGPPGGMAVILQDLRLSDKQQEKVQEILKAHHDKMRKQAEQARDDLLKQLKGVLSEEQYNKVKEPLQRMPLGLPDQPPGRRPGGREGAGDPLVRPGPGRPREGGEGRGGPGGAGRQRGPGGPGGMERILADLKLNDKQMEQARDVLRANRERLLKEMKEVLSEEQYNRFKERLENRGPPTPPPGRRDREGERRDRPAKP